MFSNAAGAMPKAKRDPRRPSLVDAAVGRNVRFWRLSRGLSQARLANRLGITFQQVQKYETGGNRIGTGRLVKIAAILRVPISTLFQGADDDEALLALISDSRSFRLAHAFAAIKHNRFRVSLVELVESVAAAQAAKRRRR
jgi:transcriptional regulator with XRE-family HTH domain